MVMVLVAVVVLVFVLFGVFHRVPFRVQSRSAPCPTLDAHQFPGRGGLLEWFIAAKEAAMSSPESRRPSSWIEWLASRTGIAFLVFAGIALTFLIYEHRVHTLGILPYLLVLACPLMHLFHGHGQHGGHGGHAGGQPHDHGAARAPREEQR
jgi:hypothetical protein